MTRSVEKSDSGVLYVVATPIGNLADITYRAVEVLQSADVVAAEDTRHTSRLFSRYRITTRLVSCHEHNEEQRAQSLVEQMENGASVALVSDAGTPSVSDPGYRIVSAALAAGVRVVPIPGVSAVTAALCASGLPSDHFCFAGFLPKKAKRQQEMLSRLAGTEQTLIFYESTKRLSGLLKLLFQYLGDRQAVVAREITKRHEEFLRGSLSVLIADVEKRDAIKGEVTVLVSGKTPESGDAEQIPQELIAEIRDSLSAREDPPSRLAAKISRKYRISKNRVYRLILDYSDEV
ncbi:MAG: 16S rRNA (cytidine(1402)-2'-O)-methyltransferase [Desulfobacterales bacterium]|nr:16S rRNA (cytidine(1402)-2'-O)-methyltransferase [Desulfobacterales bacterium]MBS3754926.1 16S rRNA (cytidine(1402)-2'-O)-methyltransferase [Desulfobacterales bacterium]